MSVFDKIFGSQVKLNKKYRPNPTEPKTKRVNILLQHSLYIRLKGIAKSKGLTIGDVCEEAFIDYVNNEKIGE